MLSARAGDDKPIVTPQWPMAFDLGSDPAERYNLFNSKMDMGWMIGPAIRPVTEWKKSVAQYPNIETGAEFEGYPSTTEATP